MSLDKVTNPSVKGIDDATEYVFVDPATIPTDTELAQQESNRRVNNIAKTVLLPITFFALGPAQTLARFITGAVVSTVVNAAIDVRFPKT